MNLYENLLKKRVVTAALIMNNVRFHKSGEIKNIIERDRFGVLYLLHYFFFLNPIENVFSKWKQYARQARVNSGNKLVQYIQKASEIVVPSDCNRYYRNMMNYFSWH